MPPSAGSLEAAALRSLSEAPRARENGFAGSSAGLRAHVSTHRVESEREQGRVSGRRERWGGEKNTERAYEARCAGASGESENSQMTPRVRSGHCTHISICPGIMSIVGKLKAPLVGMSAGDSKKELDPPKSRSGGSDEKRGCTRCEEWSGNIDSCDGHVGDSWSCGCSTGTAARGVACAAGTTTAARVAWPSVAASVVLARLDRSDIFFGLSVRCPRGHFSHPVVIISAFCIASPASREVGARSAAHARTQHATTRGCTGLCNCSGRRG